MRLVAIGGALAATAAVVALVPTAHADGSGAAPAACELRELPMPQGGQAGTVLGAMPDGTTLFGNVPISFDPPKSMAVLWRDGKIVQEIPDLPSSVVDLNSKGAATGTQSTDQPLETRPWVHQDGKIHYLAGKSATVTAIGETGQIVGYRLIPTSTGPHIAIPVMWPSATEEPIDLPMPPPGQQTGRAQDIAADGTIVGVVGSNAYVWRPDGTHALLKRPDDLPANELAAAAKINGEWAIGSARGSVRWNVKTDVVERIPELPSSVDAVNEHGWVAGQDFTVGAVAVIDGKTVKLPGKDERTAHAVRSISPDGKTFGGYTFYRPPMSERPVYWTCP
ncbi:hypothetical protein [Herbihabitans rhizosphaerae]|uniref:hypothetical protein n=1 Tax=Herbihabitans rhizosphaerae TaxID=1872711 RepID=UPI00102C94DC|nr:hypothetical protein [Herbihabitans rhizosphaerae]